MTAFSQTGTDTSRICLPTNVARLVAQDLISGDSVREELQVTKNVLVLTEKKLVYQDSVISGLVNKNNIYKNQVLLYKSKDTIYNKQLNLLEKKNKNLKVKNKISIGFAIISFIVATTIMLTNQ